MLMYNIILINKKIFLFSPSYFIIKYIDYFVDFLFIGDDST